MSANPAQKRKRDVVEEEEPNIFYRQASSRVLVKSNLALNEILFGGKALSAMSFTMITPIAEPSDFCLPYMQSVLFACILEDCIIPLRILDELNNELRIIKTLSDFDNLRSKKYQIKQHKEKDEVVAGLNNKNLDSMAYKLDKLAADRLYCVEVLTATYLELSLRRCFSSLVDSNDDCVEKEAHRFALVEEEAKNKISRRELMRQLRQQRRHMKTVAYDTEVIIDELRSKVEDATLVAETRTRYIDNWQRARTEQHEQSIHDREEGSSKSIKYYTRRMDQEQRIHSEVEMLVNIFITEALNKVEQWMNKYDIDMEAVDLKIQIMKSQYQQQVDKKKEMEETYAEHEILMKNWINFKEERRKAKEYEEKMTKSAIIVQAWWRGILVRLQMGPYRPTKKKKAVQEKKKNKK